MPSKWDVERAVMRDTRGKADRAWILDIPPLPAPARHIMHVLLTRADVATAVVSDEHTPSLTELEHLTGYTRSTIRKWLNHLEAEGWTVRDRPTVAAARRDWERTKYQLKIPGRAPDALPNIATGAPDALGLGRETDGGRAPDALIPSPDLSDPGQPLSPAGPAAPVPAPRTDGNGQGEREELIEWIKERHRPGGRPIDNPRAYLRTCEARGDYPDLVKAMHADRAQRASQTPSRPKPPWCEDPACDPNSRLRERPEDGRMARCKKCHPLTQPDTTGGPNP